MLLHAGLPLPGAAALDRRQGGRMDKRIKRTDGRTNERALIGGWLAGWAAAAANAHTARG